MSQHDLIFFIAGLLAFFLFALALQMRMLAGIALKRAARAKFEALDESKARFAVVNAVNGSDALEPGDETGDAAAYLASQYPAAIGHVRLARKGTMLMGGLLLVIIAAWRLTGAG